MGESSQPSLLSTFNLSRFAALRGGIDAEQK